MKVVSVVGRMVGHVSAFFDAEIFPLQLGSFRVIIRQEMETASEKILEPLPGTRIRPWRHQVEAFTFSSDRTAALYNMGMGTGKTLVAISRASFARRTLIVCPKSVIAVWEREFREHSDGSCHVLVPSGSVKQRAREITHALGLHERLAMILNYEAVWREPVRQKILGVLWDLVVADESQKIKAPGSRVSRFFALLRTRALNRLCLTGTPLHDSPLDAYGQFRFLDPSVFGESFFRFRARYAVLKERLINGVQFREVVGYQNLEEFRARMAPLTFTARTDDVLDLPPSTMVERRFELSREERRVYRELERTFVAELESGSVTAANAAVKLSKLQQVASGFLLGDSGVVHRIEVSKRPSRMEALLNVLDEAGGEPVVVSARFVEDLRAIHNAATIQGRESDELSGRRDDLAETGGRWRPEGPRVLALQERTGGVGIDLSAARICVLYTPGFSLGDHEQLLARVRRPGQTRPVVYVRLIAEGTVDERIYTALDHKRDVVTEILEGLRKGEMTWRC